MADAQGLLDFYTELEKTFPQRPNKHSMPKIEHEKAEWIVNSAPASAAVRSDNSSGYAGIYRKREKWSARICYQHIRYELGTFDSLDEAVDARKNAERLLKEDPDHFAEEYAKYPHHSA